MGALELALALFVLGIVLFWGGYYVALVTAWRAGARGVGTAVALLAGVCCCGGVWILAIHWEKVQRLTFEAIANGGDPAVHGARLRRYRVASAVAAVGMVLQLLAGYVAPDDEDRYDDYSYDPDDASEAWAYDDRADERYEDEDAPEAYADEEPAGALERDRQDEAAPDHSDELALDRGAPSLDEPPPAAQRSAVSGVFVGLSRDGRAAFVLDPAGGMWVRLARGRITGLEPGVTVHARGEPSDGVLVVEALEDAGLATWLEMPRPRRLEAELSSPPSDRVGRWVIVPSVRAVSATEVMARDGTALRVRAPRGLLARDTDYAALRGALVDTRPVDRRGGIELWIAREDDVIAAH